jgi:hypothetical protein
LIEIWLNDPDRAAVTPAANEIEQHLNVSPHTRGESRSAGRRVLIEPLLGIPFDIDTQDRRVRVLNVWRIPKR